MKKRTLIFSAAAILMVVLAVPFAAQASTANDVAAELQGKILVDVTVPLVPPKVARVQLPAGGSAVDALQKHHAQRIFSTSPFGGYLLSRDIKAFIDGRAELFGEQFVLDYFDAVTGKDVDTLLRIFDKYQIDATLLTPGLPATKIMDHLAGWKRLYADEIAVVHVRDDQYRGAAVLVPELRR